MKWTGEYRKRDALLTLLIGVPLGALLGSVTGEIISILQRLLN